MKILLDSKPKNLFLSTLIGVLIYLSLITNTQ
jgi:hypothetical protein